MKNLTNEEKTKLHNKTKSEIERLEQISGDVETIQLLDSFKNKFNICESAYKVILFEHQKAKGKDVKMKKLKIDMKQVPYALNFAGYTFDSNLLNELFGSNSNINGCKTVKILRDSITHSINQQSVNETKDRAEELFGYMDTFLDTIKNFDNEEAIK